MIKALVAVYECDLCGAMRSVDKLVDEQLERFQAAWHCGRIKTFCEKCRTTQVALDWAREEPRIVARYDRLSREAAGGEYVN